MSYPFYQPADRNQPYRKPSFDAEQRQNQYTTISPAALASAKASDAPVPAVSTAASYAVVAPGEIRVGAVDYGQPVGKQIDIATGGAVTKQHLTRPPLGTVIQKTFARFEEFANWNESLPSNVMRLTGTFEDGVDGAQVQYKDAVFPGTDIVAATKGFLAFRAGPGILSIDVDYKSEAEVVALYGKVRQFATHDELYRHLIEVAPWLHGIALQISDSSSSFIYDAQGQQITGRRGMHVDIWIDDATQIPRVLELLHKQFWLAGYGWSFVSDGGTILHRSPVDLALTRPHQPIFGAPSFGYNGGSSRRVFTTYPGIALVASSVPDLTADEEAEYAKLIQGAEAALQPAADGRRADVKQNRVDTLVAAGVSRERAYAQVSSMFVGDLYPDTVIQFADGDREAVTARELLINGGKFDGRLILDPREPDYPASVWFFWNDGLNPRVFGYVHGRCDYRLVHDGSSLRALLDAIPEALDESQKRRLLVAFGSAALNESMDADVIKAATTRMGMRANATRRFMTDAQEVASRYGALAPPLIEPSRCEPVAVGGADHVFSLTQRLGEGILPVVHEPRGDPGPNVPPPEKPVNHIENFAVMFPRYGFHLFYNQITKQVSWSYDGPDDVVGTETDNREETLFAYGQSLANLNDIGIEGLGSHLIAIADRNQVNPVVKHLSGLAWDGVPRFDEAAARFGARNPEVAVLAVRVFFLQACAAADACEIGTSQNEHAHRAVEHVIVFLSGQGRNKTKGLRNLLPKPLRAFFKAGAVLDTHNKDSLLEALGHWVVELGELDATFRKSDISSLKSFLSKTWDDIRRPYGRAAVKMSRRTVFVGTVNEVTFLRDKTGNRRYLPIELDRFPTFDDAFLEQLWAEAWYRYSHGEQWWPTEDEKRVLEAGVTEHEELGFWDEAVLARFNWESDPMLWTNRVTASDLLDVVHPRGNPSNAEMRAIGDAFRRLWKSVPGVAWEGTHPMAPRPDGTLVRANATGGKHRGWLVPPIRMAEPSTAPPVPAAKPDFVQF